jgi:subtilase family serine protease
MDIPDINEKSRLDYIKKTGLGEIKKAIPHLKWKYNYNDGNLNNTIGSSVQQSVPALPIPLPGSGYSPSQIAKAYGFDKISSIGDGRGKTIAIIVAVNNPNIQKDLNTFCAAYGIPTTTVHIHHYPVKSPIVYSSQTMGGIPWGLDWAQEATLDVQWAHAMAPGAKIVVVVAGTAQQEALLNAVRYAAIFVKADVINMSWGSNDWENTGYDYDSYSTVFRERQGQAKLEYYFAHRGVNYVAAAGDKGGVVSYPSVSPSVVSVGGTSLIYNSSSNTVTSETAWDRGGGGVSEYIPAPDYQADFNTSLFRSTPDLSLVADPYTGVSVYFTPIGDSQGGWYVFGGTSVSAVIMSALLARRASLGNAGTTPFNEKAYSLARTDYSRYFRDITEGSTGKPAGVGYDLATGLGCPIADQIVQIPA